MLHHYKETPDFVDNMAFGKFLRKKRRLVGLNQTDMAELLGYNQSTISKWEREINSPPIEEAKAILEFLGGEMTIVNKESVNDYKSRMDKHCINVFNHGVIREY